MRNQKPLNLLFIANNISGVAQGITLISIPWYFKMQGQTHLFSQIYFLVTLVTIVWSTYAGTLVDRLDRKKIFLVISVIGGITMTALAIAGFVMGKVELWMVLFALMNTIFIYNIHWNNLWALVQEMTEPANYSRVTSRMEIQNQVTFALSGALGAILLSGTDTGGLSFFGLRLPVPLEIKPWSMYAIFALDACTYWIAILIIRRIRFEKVKERFIDKSPLLDRLSGGFRYLWKEKTQLVFGLCSFVVFICIIIAGFLLMAEYVGSFLNAGADVYASNEVFFALGAIACGLGIRYLFGSRNSVRGILLLTALACVVQFIQFSCNWIWVFYACCMLMGASNAGIRILRANYQFEHLPNQVMGRVQSVFGIFVSLSRLFLAFVFANAFFHTGDNIRYTMLVFSIMCLISVLVLMIFYRRIQNYSAKKL